MVLTELHVIGPVEPPIRDLTVGALLAEAAGSVPDRVALIAGVPATNANLLLASTGDGSWGGG